VKCIAAVVIGLIFSLSETFLSSLLMKSGTVKKRKNSGSNLLTAILNIAKPMFATLRTGMILK